VAESIFRNTPVDRRRLSKQDRRDHSRGAGQTAVKQHRRMKARKAAMNYRDSVQPRTTTRLPGSGGFLRGREIQALRLRKQGQENRRAEQLRYVGEET